MEIFKPTKLDDGKTFIVRPLLNAKGMKNKEPHVMVLETGMKGLYGRPLNNYLCYALVDDELRILQFGEKLRGIILQDQNEKSGLLMLDMKSDRAIKITMRVRQGFADPLYEIKIIHDDKYRFDDTKEKREYISNLLYNTDLDLSKALEKATENIRLLKENKEREIEAKREKYKDIDPYGEEMWEDDDSDGIYRPNIDRPNPLNVYTTKIRF